MGGKNEHLCQVCKKGPKCLDTMAHAGKHWDTANFDSDRYAL